MLYVQKYHNLGDIDLEFIPTLESLLSENIPSFEWMVSTEKEIPEDIYFTYYLFFGDKHNSPVGFARMELEQCKKNRPGFFKRLFSKDKNEVKPKIAKWQTSFSFGEGLTFDPMYIKPGLLTTNKLINEYQKREDIQGQRLTFYQAYNDLEQSLNNVTNKKERIIAHTLIKSKASYKDYLLGLKDETQEKVKKSWKMANSLYTIAEFTHFKEVFQYRKDGANLLSALKKLPDFSKIKDHEVTYLTLEEDNEILAIIMLIKGHHGNYFYNFCLLKLDLDQVILHQIAILHFFEKEDANKLHPMKGVSDLAFFQEMGFTTRKQWYIEIEHE